MEKEASEARPVGGCRRPTGSQERKGAEGEVLGCVEERDVSEERRTGDGGKSRVANTLWRHERMEETNVSLGMYLYVFR